MTDTVDPVCECGYPLKHHCIRLRKEDGQLDCVYNRWAGAVPGVLPQQPKVAYVDDRVADLEARLDAAVARIKALETLAEHPTTGGMLDVPFCGACKTSYEWWGGPQAWMQACLCDRTETVETVFELQQWAAKQQQASP